MTVNDGVRFRFQQTCHLEIRHKVTEANTEMSRQAQNFKQILSKEEDNQKGTISKLPLDVIVSLK